VIARVREYFVALSSAAGVSWNRFWFTPRRADTLGVLRVLAGVMALYAVATYAPDLERWFGAGGMLPVDMVRSLYEHHWSMLDIVPPRLLWPAYATSLAVIALFTLGVGGRLAAVLAAAATLSFFSRAPLVTGEFEPILAMLLVYLSIGRASDAYSLPAFLRHRSAPPGSSLQPPGSPSNSISLRLIQLHLAIVHLMMGCAQLAAPESAWWNGEGMWLAATRPGMALVDLSFLEDHPRVVAAWSHLVTLYLLSFPVLAWNRWARPLVLAVGVFVWISLAAASGWLMFCLAMLTGLVAFADRESDVAA
jgi:hypothetical protein